MMYCHKYLFDMTFDSSPIKFSVDPYLNMSNVCAHKCIRTSMYISTHKYTDACV